MSTEFQKTAGVLHTSFGLLKILACVGAIAVSFPVSAGILTVGPNRNITRSVNNQTETTIAVNPANPQNLFAAANGGFSYTTKAGLPSVFYYSTNGGTTWLASDVSALPVSCCDQSTSWDNCGNLFLTYLAQTGPAVAALSTNGGASFILLYESPGAPDQPTITTGPGGSYAPGSVWLTYASGSVLGLVAVGAPVNGLGNVGAFGAEEPVPGGGTFGDVAVGPNGEVLVTYQSGGTSPDNIGVNLDPDGLGPAGFNPAVAVTTTQIGGFVAIPAQSRRTIDAEAGLAWDRTGGPHHGRIYLVYTDRPSTTSADTDIYVRYSDDLGSTWSSRLRVNDDTVGNGKSQFLPRIALDQTTGNIGVSFYDCRNSSPNTTAEYWATVSVDGGVSFQPNVKVSQGVSSANVIAVSTYKFDFGDYSGLTFQSGTLYPCWGDNSNSTGDNPEGTLTTLDAYFAALTVAPLFDIVVAVVPSGAGAVTGAGYFTNGAPISLQATPNAGFVFESWTEGGTVVSANSTLNVTVSTNRLLTANFAPIPQLHLQVGGGSASFSWPTNASGFQLEQSLDLAAGNWTSVTNAVAVVGGENRVTVSPLADLGCFRLRKP